MGREEHNGTKQGEDNSKGRCSEKGKDITVKQNVTLEEATRERERKGKT